MSTVKIEQFAKEIDTPIARLLVQLEEAGIEGKKAGDDLKNDEKRRLLAHLRQSHGKKENTASTAPKKITLNRKTVSKLKIPGSQGKKTVNVEVRKKRTYIKRNPAQANAGILSPALASPLAATPSVELLGVGAGAANIAQQAGGAGSIAHPAVNLAVDAKSAAEAAARKKVEVDANEKQKVDQEKSQTDAEKRKQADRTRIDTESAERKKRAKDKVQTEIIARRQAETKAKVRAQAKAESEALAKAEVIAVAKAKAQAAVAAIHAKNNKTVDGEKEQTEAVESDTQDKKTTQKKSEHKTAQKKTPQKKTAAPQNDSQRGRRRTERRSKNKNALGDDSATGRHRKKGRQSSVAKMDNEHGFTKPVDPISHEVSIPETISVTDLAQKMSVKAAEVIRTMMTMGSMVTINQVIDQETASIVVEEMGHRSKLMNDNDIEVALSQEEFEGEKVPRAPVVTIMGHVDHGKTSLLDYIRASRVAAGEAGGITQHIGAYHVDHDKGMLCFLDTPGHEAFTAMRSRGAKITDIVVLVVAADDGVMPRTIEAIQHARAANVPIVVAVNKIDKPAADIDRVKQELVAQEVIPEEWGGDVMFVNVSAKTGEGIDALLDAILLQSEVLELRTVAEGPAHGVVIESRIDKGRGVVATILIQRGVLNRGDMLLVGHEYGRVRAMLDENGKPIENAGPSIPVEVLGLSGTPAAGAEAMMVTDERKAREVALFRQGKFREVRLASQQAAKLENMFNKMEAGETSTLNIVLKADVHGSVEALRESLIKLSTDEVKVAIISASVGGINESDVHLAVASSAIVIGFNVRADANARRLVSEQGVDLHYYSIIYEALDEVKSALSGLLAPEIREEIIGLAEVRDVFRVAKIGAVAGCMVLEGLVKRNDPIRVLRDNVVIFEGELESLRRFKEDTAEVKAGMECGIGVKNYADVKVGDQIEVYHQITIERSL